MNQRMRRSIATIPIGIIGVVVIAILGACSTYRAQPLSDEAVNTALTPPTWPELQVRVADLHHLRLPTQSINPAGPFSPEQLALVAVVANPGLRAIRAEHALAEAQLLQAGILPNPQLSVGTDLAVSSPDGLATPGNAVGLSWDLSGLITRGAKRAAAQAHVEQVALDIAWQEWVVAEGAKQAAVKIAAAEARLTITRELAALLAEQHALVAQGFATGVTTILENNASEVASNDTERQVHDNEHELLRLRLQLNRLLGLPPEQTVVVRVESWATRLDIPMELVGALTDRRLDLIALRRGYDSQEEGLRAAILGQFPKFGLSLARATDTSNVRTLNLGVTIDLPLFDRNQGVIASETATRQKLFDEYTQRVFEARSDLAIALADAAALSRIIVIIDGQAQAAQVQTKALQQAVEARAIDALSASASAIQLLQKRQDAVTLREQLAETAIAIELAAGQVLAHSPATVGKENP